MPASGWPMVPLISYTPSLVVPPPPSTVNQSMEYCAKAELHTSSTSYQPIDFDLEGLIGTSWSHPFHSSDRS